MKFVTKVEIEPLNKRIDYSHKLFFMGSCFASEIGEKLSSLRFDIRVNPFGVLYNPASITTSLGRLESGRPFDADELIRCGDIFKSFMHGSEFAAMSTEDFLNSNNSILDEASSHFDKSEWIVLSLGTSWVYKLKKGGQVVSNCHKLPATYFERYIMGIDEIVECFAPIIERYPRKEWIFTVSPIRHWKDGAHGNQLSKARLLLAIDILSGKYENVHYFPAYELMLDELRDYRFYADDMLHPSPLAVDHIWGRFVDFVLDSGCVSRMKKVTALNDMRRHRPIFPESEECKKFMNKIEELEKELDNETTIKL